MRMFKDGVEVAVPPITLPQAVVALCERFALTPEQAVEKLLQSHSMLEAMCVTDEHRLAITTRDDLDFAWDMLRREA